MPELWAIIGLVIGVLAITGLAAAIRLPAPILLLGAGFAASFIPGVPAFAVDPDVVLFLLIPPLLYAAAVESGVVAIKRLLSPIMQLAFGMVIVTAAAVALVVHLLLPSVPLGAALALGAIVAPPDAVSAIAVGRRVGLPRTVMTVLEGESLFNDATSLTLLRVALAAVGASSIGWGPAVGLFAWSVVGGVGVGLVIGHLLSLVRRLVGKPLTVTVLSLVTPFAAYLIGEQIHASGVLAVVTAGLLLGHRSPVDLPAKVRLTEQATWDALRFVVEGTVFALIGLQLWDIVAALDASAAHVVATIVSVLAVVLVVRPLWVFAGALLTRLWRPHSVQRAKNLAAISWSGMRGVISLAAAQTLPLDTPGRPILLTCTVAVIVGTLVLQGLSLPWVVRKLDIGGDPDAERDAERDAARKEASRAIARRIDEVAEQKGIPPRQAEMMHRWASLRDWRSWSDAESDHTAGFRLRRLAVVQRWQSEIVAIERDVFVQLRNSGKLSEEVLRDLQQDLDLEEALLESRAADRPDQEAHLEELPDVEPLHRHPDQER
jgi:CPA1 family monovalent cation:H+ antiporter